MSGESEELRASRLRYIGFVDETSTPAYGTKEKRALDIPPDLSKRAFIQSHWALPDSVDIPPEINGEFLLARLLGLEFVGAEAPQNGIKLPKNQDTGSI